MKLTWKVHLIRFAICLLVIPLLGGCSTWQPETSLVLPTSNVSERHLSAQYFGTSTLLVSDGDISIMVDGFFSRPSLFDALFNGMNPDETQIEKVLHRANLYKIDILLVAHSHYDHVLDSGTVAFKTGALLIGSESSTKIASEKDGLNETQIQTIKPGEKLKKGLFEISFYETPHSPKSMFMSFIEGVFLMLARGSDYKDSGQNYSFFLSHPGGKILIVPSANYIPRFLGNVKADVVFLSIGTLGKQPEGFIRGYWKETVVNTGAKLIIPIHWDNFSRSLESPMKPSPFVFDDIKRSMDILQRLAEEDKDNIISIKFVPVIDKFDLHQKGI